MTEHTAPHGSHRRTRFLVQFAVLIAIEAILSFTPLGSIPIGPIVATLFLLPVIIAAITMGTKAGAALGFIAGLFSFLVWTFMPANPATAFLFTPFYSFGEFHGNFWSLVICFVPRILVGVVTGVSFKAFSKRWKNDVLSYGVSGVLGSLTNTVLVLGGIYLFFGVPYAQALGTAYSLLLGVLGLTVLTNGIPEAVVSFITAFAVGKPLRAYTLKDA